MGYKTGTKMQQKTTKYTESKTLGARIQVKETDRGKKWSFGVFYTYS